MERLLNEQIADQVSSAFANIEEPVTILFFGNANDDHHNMARQLLEEISELSSLLTLQIYDPEQADETVQEFEIDKFPAIAFARQNGENLLDTGARIFGVPSGHEFTALIHTIIIVAQKQSSLKKETLDFLNNLTQPVKLEVFSTPT